MSLLLVGIGVVFLYLGGEFLVRNAGHLAVRFGVSPLVIGLTVVAFGTSSPELAATLVSAFDGVPEVAIGNVIGSNIANIGLILGFSALLTALPAPAGFFRREVPLVLGSGVLLVPLLWEGRVGRLEGGLLLLGLALYLWLLFRADEGPLDEIEDLEDAKRVPTWRAVAGVLLGISGLVLGARALITGAVDIAEGLGVPERVIGLTLVAFGTSLPELASSLVAAARRETELLLGNVIGSNVFNVLAVLGTTALVQPLTVERGGVAIDLAVMLAFSALVAPLMWRRRRLFRWGGVLLAAGYVTYVVALFL